MATTTVPDIGIAPVSKTITTLHLIDVSGDLYASSIQTTTAPTLVEIEALKAAYQAATQASIWKVTFAQEWIGSQSTANADSGSRDSIADGVNLLYKDTASLDSQTPRLIAPAGATMDAAQDIPVLTSAELTALNTAIGGILTSYELVNAQYTERRERSNNPRVKP